MVLLHDLKYGGEAVRGGSSEALLKEWAERDDMKAPKGGLPGSRHRASIWGVDSQEFHMNATTWSGRAEVSPCFSSQVSCFCYSDESGIRYRLRSRVPWLHITVLTPHRLKQVIISPCLSFLICDMQRLHTDTPGMK